MSEVEAAAEEVVEAGQVLELRLGARDEAHTPVPESSLRDEPTYEGENTRVTFVEGDALEERVDGVRNFPLTNLSQADTSLSKMKVILKKSGPRA